MADGGRGMTEFRPGPDTVRAFRGALGRFATGVTIVTTRHDDAPVGITANSFASVSLDPPLVLWSPAKASRRYPVFARAERFAIHVLADRQGDMARRFVAEGNPFEALDWVEGTDGVPLIEGCLARFDCRTEAVHDAGDHSIVIGRVEGAKLGEGEPLVFAHGRYGRFAPDAE